MKNAYSLCLSAILGALALAACPLLHKPDEPAAPAAPSDLAAFPQSSSSVQVAWSDNSDNEDCFVLEYDTIEDFSGKDEISLPVDATEKLVEGLDASTKHYFRVKAVNGVGASAYSNVADATTQVPPLQAPAAPGALAATATSSSSIQADWTDNSDNEDNFVIACSKSADFAVSSETTLPANTTSNQLISLEAKTKYYLRVRATNSAGGSAWSDTAEATTLGVIAGTMVINDGAACTNRVSVTIYSSILGATQMRFQNADGDWSAWEPYATGKAWTLTSGEGTKTVNGEFQDAVGTMLPKSDSILLDTTPPAVSSFLINNGEAYAISTGVALSYTVTGATRMRFINTGGGVHSTWEPYAASKAWTLIAGDGPKTVYGEFEDDAGNWTEAWDYITLDTQPPIVSSFQINGGAAYTNSTSVTLSCAVTGAAQMRFQNVGAAWSAWEPYAASKAWTLTSGDASRSVFAQFLDAAGNLNSGTAYDEIILDTQAPVVSYFQINGGAAYTNSTSVTLNCTVTGATQMRFTNSQGLLSDWMPYAESIPWTLASGDGVKGVGGQFADAAGNLTGLGQVQDVITLDTVAPVVNIDINAGLAWAWTPAATLDISASGGATEMRLRIRHNNWYDPWLPWEVFSDSTKTRSLTIPAAENEMVYIYAQFKDAAGNVAEDVDAIYYDAIRRHRFTAEWIYIEEDTDAFDPGEIFWYFDGWDTKGEYFVIYNTPQSPPAKIESMSSYEFEDVSVIVTSDNMPGESFQIRFQLADDDGLLGIDWSNENRWEFSRDAGWGDGPVSEEFWMEVDGWPNGTMYFRVEYVD